MANQQRDFLPEPDTSESDDLPKPQPEPSAGSVGAIVPPTAVPRTAVADEPGEFSEGFFGPQTAELVGISYRQLDHWARKGLVRPSVAEAAGSGSRRRYSYNDLVELKIAKKMRDQGIDLKSIARAFDYLRNQLGGEVASATIVISGSDVLMVDDDQVLSLLRQGQAAMLNVLSVAGVRRELDADVVKLFPDEPIAVQLSFDIGDESDTDSTS
ncbi:MerR family transcriptional regulator [Candidatus Poriferisodalis sp.]|uniref:MerR family transcriptional regulator n=1 Tax=Candidatus Poriferisodalis sp. TaxID=3101277 RepID=UPI003B5B7939